MIDPGEERLLRAVAAMVAVKRFGPGSRLTPNGMVYSSGEDDEEYAARVLAVGLEALKKGGGA